ncbi:MAG TPA: DinB family protein [Vicinamibacterales bacterium]|jgi:tRNA-binding protein
MAETFEQYIARMLALAGTGNPLEVLEQTAPRMGALIAARSDADLTWRPADDRWSIAQILAHLADAEVVAAWRLRMILSAPGSPIQSFDQNGWARALEYERRDAFASLALFRALRASLLGLVRHLGDEALDRYGMHAERGKETVRHLLRMYAGHDVNHLQQIERLLAERDRERERGRPFAPQPIKPLASLEALQQLDIRVGTIRSVSAVPGTERLAALTVDFGDRQRTIVAGIRTERTSPEALINQQALFVVNLPPKTIRGQMSEGMLFDAGYEDGLRPALVQPEWPIPNGARAG